MTIRSFTLAAFATVALAACNKPADTPAVIDSAAPANATPTIATPTDSTLKADSLAPKPVLDSSKPATHSAKPVMGGNPAK